MGIFVENLKEIIKEDITASEKLFKMIDNHFRVLARRSSLSNCHSIRTYVNQI